MIWFRALGGGEWLLPTRGMGAVRGFVPQCMIAQYIVANDVDGAMDSALKATTAATAMTATIDRRALLEGLSLGGVVDPSLASEVMALFLSDAPKLLQSIRDGVSTHDQTTLRRAAHTLKSSAGMVAATDLAGVAASVEAHARASRIDDITPLLPRLDFLLGTAIRELSVIRAQLEAVRDGVEKQ